MTEYKPAGRTRAVLPINLGDGAYCEQWIRRLSEIIKPDTTSLDVVFLGGGAKVNPSVILSLRNALLLVPQHIKLRTVASASLSPFFCAVWLLGDERWIARNARIWIPRLPETILRGGETEDHAAEALQNRVRETDNAEDGAGGDEGEAEDLDTLLRNMVQPKRAAGGSHQPGLLESECGCDRCRIITELRTLATVVNEWLPCWEFSGKAISSEDLVEMRVIRPDWVFGNPSSGRARARHVSEVEPEVKQDGEEAPALQQSIF